MAKAAKTLNLLLRRTEQQTWLFWFSFYEMFGICIIRSNSNSDHHNFADFSKLNLGISTQQFHRILVWLRSKRSFDEPLWGCLLSCCFYLQDKRNVGLIITNTSPNSSKFPKNIPKIQNGGPPSAGKGVKELEIHGSALSVYIIPFLVFRQSSKHFHISVSPSFRYWSRVVFSCGWRSHQLAAASDGD